MRGEATARYATDVIRGKIPTGRLVQLACRRHLDDLRSGKNRGLYFDEIRADHAIDFFSFLRLDGDETRPFILLPWEIFIVGSLFGWLNPDGTRRFRTAYIEAGKGSGKTPLAAGIADYGLMADEEWAAEIYCAAVTREQAHTAFRDAKRMVESNPDLASRLSISEHNIAYLPTNSFLRTASSEGRSLDSKRVHIAVIDEIHEHRTPIVVDKMDLGKKGRRQPLTIEITNSGYNKESVCYHHHEYSRAILEKRIQNDAWFAYVCQLDPCRACAKSGRLSPRDECKDCDDWRDEKVWIKTNPSLGADLPRIDYLREKVRETIGMPAKQNIVKRLNFCLWTEQETRWLDLSLWDAGAQAGPDLAGRACFGGLDLSSNRDLTAWAKLFPPLAENEPWHLVSRFWIPADNVAERVKKDGVPYDLWIDQGWIETTPGNVVDKDHIEQAVLEDAAMFQLLRIGFDRLFADQLVQHLENEKPGYVSELQFEAPDGKIEMLKQWCLPIGMGFYSMAAPCKELERLIHGKMIRHGGNPVLRWNAGNISVRLDPAGNMKPDKEKSTERIDGIVAALIALACALRQPQQPHKSIYDKQEVRTV